MCFSDGEVQLKYWKEAAVGAFMAVAASGATQAAEEEENAAGVRFQSPFGVCVGWALVWIAGWGALLA